VDSVAGFARWVGRLLGQADTSRPADEGYVHASHWWIAEDGTYLGAITLRYELNDFLLRAGTWATGSGHRPGAADWPPGRCVQCWSVHRRWACARCW
jgi:predicted acetyltransferase